MTESKYSCDKVKTTLYLNLVPSLLDVERELTTTPLVEHDVILKLHNTAHRVVSHACDIPH